MMLKEKDLETPSTAMSSDPRGGAGMDRKIERRFPAWLRPASAVAAGLLVLVVLFVVFMPKSGRTLRLGAERVTISDVSRSIFEDFIPVRGRVTPLDTIYLDAIEGGRVEEVHLEDGALVSEGQILVTLSNTSLQLDVISREAEVTEQINNLNTLELQLEQNRLTHKRSLIEIDYQITRLSRLMERRSALLDDGHISRQDYDTVADELAYWTRRRDVTLEAQATDERLQQTQMEQLTESAAQLRRNLAFARKNLDNLKVRAPASGKLTAFDVKVGQSLARGERIGQIDDPDDFKLTALIDEFYLPRMDVGQTARAEINGRAYDLALAKIYPQVRDGQFEIDLTFKDKMPGDIRRGQTLQLRLSLGASSEATLIPNGAFYQDTGGNWVFVVTPDNSAALKRSVRLGRRNARYIEVLDGLEPGEKVVTSPYTGFADMERLEFGE